MASGHRSWLEVEGFRLAAWSWGDGPLVVLHHGWGGRASQMASFAPPLVEAGFSVIAYDAPAHGDSPGRITAAPEMARILRAVDRRVMGIHAVIGHSLGCAVTLLAIREGLQLDRAVLLAAPSDLRRFIDAFAPCIGLDPSRFSDLGDYAAAKFNADWQEMHIGHWQEGAHPPLLIFHDLDDEILDLDHAQAIVEGWGNARLIVTEKLGHRRIRRDPELVRVAVEFLAEGNARQSAQEASESDPVNRELSSSGSPRVPS